MRELTMTHTRVALVEYDAGEQLRADMWYAAGTTANVIACQKADADALRKVQMAFFEDTKDRNGLQHCLIVDLAFMRRMVAEHPEAP